MKHANWREYALWPEAVQTMIGLVLMLLLLPLLLTAFIMHRLTGYEMEGGEWLLMYIAVVGLVVLLMALS
jgi:hypothetical protein